MIDVLKWIAIIAAVLLAVIMIGGIVLSGIEIATYKEGAVWEGTVIDKQQESWRDKYGPHCTKKVYVEVEELWITTISPMVPRTDKDATIRFEDVEIGDRVTIECRDGYQWITDILHEDKQETVIGAVAETTRSDTLRFVAVKVGEQVVEFTCDDPAAFAAIKTGDTIELVRTIRTFVTAEGYDPRQITEWSVPSEPHLQYHDSGETRDA